MPAVRFEDAENWKKAHAFVLETYEFTAQFPSHELYGLTSQLRRAAVSITANFADGFGKSTRPDKLRFYGIAVGSLEEYRYYLILAADLGYGDTRSPRAGLDEVGRMLGDYIKKIKGGD